MTLEKVKEAFDARRKADRDLEAALKEAIKFGAVVYWEHGDQTRRAMALRVSGDRIQVRGDNSDYWIYAFRINGVKPPTRKPRSK